MLEFLISNPERFKCDSLLWPGYICLIKCVTAVGAQTACVINMLYLNDALSTVKSYAIISIIASVDTKMLNMISTIDTMGMAAKPLEFNNTDHSAWGAILRIIHKYQDGRTKIRLSSVAVTILLAVNSAILNFAYLVFYFYYGAFYPIMIMVFLYHYNKHVPCSDGEKYSYCKLV